MQRERGQVTLKIWVSTYLEKLFQEYACKIYSASGSKVYIMVKTHVYEYQATVQAMSYYIQVHSLTWWMIYCTDDLLYIRYDLFDWFMAL